MTIRFQAAFKEIETHSATLPKVLYEPYILVFDDNQWLASRTFFGLFLTSESAMLHAEEKAAEMYESHQNTLANAV